MLNGAFAVGTPDCVTHLAEEIPKPGLNVPKAIAFQMVIGFFSGFFYLITLMYAISDYEALLTAPFPVAEIYYQATGSAAGEIGLLFLLFITIILTVFGVYITAGRVLWTLARDSATPFSRQIGTIDPASACPSSQPSSAPPSSPSSSPSTSAAPPPSTPSSAPLSS